MIANIRPRLSKFISSQRTARLRIQKQSINLGRELIDEAGLRSTVDTLSRWMVHYIAEQCIISKHGIGKNKYAAKKRYHQALIDLGQRQILLQHNRGQWRKV